MKKSIKKFLFLSSLVFVASASYSQHTPYKVYDTKAVILQQPYLIDPSETGMTVGWLTDTDCQSKIMYREEGKGLTQVVVKQVNGLIPVDTKHSIRIEGLKPGTTYEYKVLSRRVVKLNPYWPDMGHWVESPVYTFTTFDKKKPNISFSCITDTHENVRSIDSLLRMVNPDSTDFFVHTGDALHWAESENQLFKNWLTPIAKGLKQRIPFIYARGNHDLRGPFARSWYDYIPTHTGKFYFATDHGPAHFIILDTGEDKPDSTNVYAGLNNLKDYRREGYAWFKNHVETSTAIRDAPFRIVFMHDPKWGWMEDEDREKWTQLANTANLNLIIAGHYHRYMKIVPGAGNDNKFPILVLGQRQIAHVNVSSDFISVEVRNQENRIIDSFQINRRGELR